MNYENYILEVFEKPLRLMHKLQLTKDELLKLDITEDGFDIEELTKLMFNRYQKQDDTIYAFRDKILWVECPYENNEFKSEIIRYMSNFPQYEIKFIEHGYQFD